MIVSDFENRSFSIRLSFGWWLVQKSLSAPVMQRGNKYIWLVKTLFKHADVDTCRALFDKNQLTVEQIERIAALFPNTLFSQAAEEVGAEVLREKVHQHCPEGVENFSGNIQDLPDDVRKVVTNSLYAKAKLT
ncbi:hypothetical protein KY333_06050, partial [Candidatus Woesearchaeota archaeon]|nr:hypothetical protein [Candidatus Woesearchaeota archaeon]